MEVETSYIMGMNNVDKLNFYKLSAGVNFYF